MIRALKALTSRRFHQYLLFLMMPGISLKRWLARTTSDDFVLSARRKQTLAVKSAN